MQLKNLKHGNSYSWLVVNIIINSKNKGEVREPIHFTLDSYSFLQVHVDLIYIYIIHAVIDTNTLYIFHAVVLFHYCIINSSNVN